MGCFGVWVFRGLECVCFGFRASGLSVELVVEIARAASFLDSDGFHS